MTMTDQPIELTDQDHIDLAKLNGLPEADVERLLSEEAPAFHTILEVWQKVLEPAAAEASKKVTPQWASKMVATYAEVSFADMVAFRDLYFARLAELARIVDVEIAGDRDCLTYTSPEDDAEQNSHHYKNIILLWNMAFNQWELDWDTTDPLAGVELGANAEAYKILFGGEQSTGLTAFLESIQFEFTEDDQAMLSETLLAQRGEQ